MQQMRVGVLRGGPSSEYDVSLKSGAAVLRNLPEERYHPVDIFIDRAGQWHVRGRPLSPERALRQVDIVFNALHGEYGEDGQVQRLLDRLGMRYTGSGHHASALAMHKERSKRAVEELGIKTPREIVLRVSENHRRELAEAFRAFAPPVVVKPISAGSSVGVVLANTFPEFSEAVSRAFEISPSVLVEEYISGKEATVGVLENFRDHEHYALLPIEIVPPEHAHFYDREVKYDGSTAHLCPGTFSEEEKQLLTEYAKEAHKAVGARHYSRSDFRVHPKRGVYYLETNTLPGLTEHSNFLHALKEAGTPFPELIEHLITLARA